MNDASTFSEAEFFEAFKKIRNRIRNHYPHEIIIKCISDLNREDAYQPSRMVRFRPWELLLLIKWTFLYGEYLSPDRKHLDDSGYMRLINLLFALGDKVRMPDEYTSLIFFIRKMAFQQFWLQENPRGHQIARQSVLFRHLNSNHTLNQTFQKEAGISIDDFLVLSVSLIVAFVSRAKQPFVTIQWFRSISNRFSTGAIESYLKIVSRDYEETQLYLEGVSKRRLSKEYEFYEQSPLKRYPLLKIGDRYFCYSPILLFHGIHSFIYDILKQADPQLFMQYFGDIFEKYVERGLNYANLKYFNEEKLKKVLREQGKVVDFFVTDGETNILIDAKGIELPPLGMLTHIEDVLKDKTETSILKAITQSYETWKNLLTIKKIDDHTISSQTPFLLVVTYKDLFIGNGKDFLHNVAKEFLPTLTAKLGVGNLIPPENMYFLSADDFDFLMQSVKMGNSLSNILSQAMQADQDTKTKKFIFRDHLKPSRDGIPDFLEEEFHSLMDTLKNLLPANEAINNVPA